MDWPSSLIRPTRGIIRAVSNGQPCGMREFLGTPVAAAWPAANRAIYMPILVEQQVVATQAYIYVGAAAGNVDFGILDTNWNRLVSIGSTAVAGTNTPQLLNFADTTLTPGHYYLAMVCSTITTLTVFRWTPNNVLLRICGVQQEALGATTIPATATPANPATGFLPDCGLLIAKAL